MMRKSIVYDKKTPNVFYCPLNKPTGNYINKIQFEIEMSMLENEIFIFNFRF